MAFCADGSTCLDRLQLARLGTFDLACFVVGRHHGRGSVFDAIDGFLKRRSIRFPSSLQYDRADGFIIHRWLDLTGFVVGGATSLYRRERLGSRGLRLDGCCDGVVAAQWWLTLHGWAVDLTQQRQECSHQ